MSPRRCGQQDTPRASHSPEPLTPFLADPAALHPGLWGTWSLCCPHCGSAGRLILQLVDWFTHHPVRGRRLRTKLGGTPSSIPCIPLCCDWRRAASPNSWIGTRFGLMVERSVKAREVRVQISAPRYWLMCLGGFGLPRHPVSLGHGGQYQAESFCGSSVTHH